MFKEEDLTLFYFQNLVKNINMGSAFTTEEQQLIRQDLKKAARKYLPIMGMKKTSLDQLIAEAGISKGAFYKFYPTKEHLFFEIMEDIHEELYSEVREILRNSKLPTAQERLENALLFTYQKLNATSVFTFMINELPYVVRKLGPDILEKHNVDDSTSITSLLDEAGIHLNYSPDFVSNLIRTIIMIPQKNPMVDQQHMDEVVHFLIHTISVQLLENVTIDPNQYS